MFEFNESLTNDVVNSEQLGPGVYNVPVCLQDRKQWLFKIKLTTAESSESFNMIQIVIFLFFLKI